MSVPIPKSEWRWYGNAGHFICANDCRFHLCTEIGDFLVSTVGQLLLDSAIREIFASERGITLEGIGDARRADWMRKAGYEDIGYGRKFETMVFRAGKRCEENDCGCGLPEIDGHDLLFEGYNRADDATRGHHAMCERVAAGEAAVRAAEERA